MNKILNLYLHAKIEEFRSRIYSYSLEYQLHHMIRDIKRNIIKNMNVKMKQKYFYVLKYLHIKRVIL
jgi:hypothetical protein